MDIAGMTHFDMAMQRVYAWFAGEIIDRPPVRFMAHNAFINLLQDKLTGMTPEERKALWFDAEYQVDLFIQSIAGKTHYGETFPIYWPNLGPDVYASFYGAKLSFGEVTSWSEPLLRDWADIEKIKLDWDNVTLKKIDELTLHALERCQGQFLVGYTDLHPGLDCCMAWRSSQQLCLDLLDNPQQVHRLAELAIADFEAIYTHFDDILKAHGQFSVNWMGIPSPGRLHIPSCDFSSMISPQTFREFCLPVLQREVKTMTHNIFHVDGKGVGRHLDAILSVPEVHAIQWVQGVGDDYPIMQWVPFIKEIQAQRPVIVDLSKEDLDDFMEVMEPEGIFLWIATKSEEEEQDLLKRISQWT